MQTDDCYVMRPRSPSRGRNANKVSSRERRDDMPRRSQFNPKIAADLRPPADGSAVRTSVVAGGG